MTRAVIIGSGTIKNYEYIKSKLRGDDYIICADGGYSHACRMGIEPDIVIGDFDSADIDAVDVKKAVYPRRKDFTDGELAVDYALDKGFLSIVLIAMTGDRLDHTAADILLLSRCRQGVLIDDNNEVYLLRDRVSISGRRGQTVSIIPVFGDAQGLVTQGLEYPLKDETLFFASSRGVSNVMLEEKCTVTIKRGMALVIKVENT